jgi:ketosteroid isomerase-like protein
MSGENVELVRRAVGLIRPFDESFRGSRVGTNLLDPAFEVHDHDSPDQDVFRGHAGFLRWIDDWDAMEWTLEPEEFVDAGERVVVLARLSARGRASGVSLVRRDGMVWTLRNGKVVRLDYFNNPGDALEAAGLRE